MRTAARGFRLAMVVCGLGAGCARQESPEEAGSSPAEAPALTRLEPRHGGRIVELTGAFDAELVISEGGMSFVFLYDAQGNPVPYEGKEVKLVVTTAGGRSEEVPLEGMGGGSGAHFMNPLSEGMLEVLRDGYVAEITVTAPDGLQTGRLEVAAGEAP
jgi:hypothetical protein